MTNNRDIIELINNLFDDSKYFLIEAKKRRQNDELTERYNKSSILFAWAGFEGWVNKTCMDFSKTIKKLTIHEKAFLIEKKIELKKGEFKICNVDKYESTEQKLEFLIVTIANKTLDKSTKHWLDFQEIKKIRDSLVHPKLGRQTDFKVDNAEKTINVLVYYLNLLSQKLYHKKFKI